MAVSRAGSPDATFRDRFDAIAANVGTVLRGKRDVIELALVCLLAEGHLLIEDVPGVGKTSLAKALAVSLDMTWRRIQFTPDLLPSDVTGVVVWNRATNQFEFRPGGVFAHLVLADEINRSSPRTQAALLEAMEERQVTVDSTTHHLPGPFMVIATQNPLEHQGTYPLPDSQLDRFLMRIDVGYPDIDAETAMLESHGATDPFEGLDPVASRRDVEEMISVAREIHVAPGVRRYIVALADATRRHPAVELGMSPRSALAMQSAARARAAADGRDFVSPDDVKALAVPVLRHRMTLTAEAGMGGADETDVIAELVESVPVPKGTVRAG